MATRRRPEDIAIMRRAGRVVAEMHAEIRAAARPGVTTAALDRVGRRVIEQRGARSNFLGYHGYPAVICASVNDVVVHGIPGEQRLEDGDLLSIDCGAIVDGWHGDAAFSMVVGEGGNAEAERLIDTAERALRKAIGTLRDGGRLGDVGKAVQGVASAAGYDVLRDYFGHAIGRAMHEEPSVPNYWPWEGDNPRLRTGHVYALEPMLVAGSPEVRTLDDGWTVVTADGSLSVHVEHTIAITPDGPQILTLP